MRLIILGIILCFASCHNAPPEVEIKTTILKMYTGVGVEEAECILTKDNVLFYNNSAPFWGSSFYRKHNVGDEITYTIKNVRVYNKNDGSWENETEGNIIGHRNFWYCGDGESLELLLRFTSI